MAKLPDNVTVIEVIGMGGDVTEHVIIDRGNDEYTSMTKEAWEAQEAARAELANYAPVVDLTEEV
jgi:hypothetical protein